jgi:hypothetical protein
MRLFMPENTATALLSIAELLSGTTAAVAVLEV